MSASSPRSSSRIDTLAVRAGQPRKDALDAVTTPIVCTATYAFSSSAELRDHFEGRIERHEYGRYGNPTVRAAEEKLAALEGGQDAALFGSGMAAITTALFALLKSGDHVVLTGDCYRRTRAFVTQWLARFGVESTIVAAGDPRAVAEAIHARTRVVLTESPTNPYLRVVDLPALAALKRLHPRVKLLVDATFATPVNQRPLSHGADLVLHSCTKYLGGHNDLLAGVVVGDEALVSLVREARDVLGAVLDPHAAYLLIRGLKTLPLRVARQNATGLEIARWLESQPEVERVFYPGLASHPDHAVARRLMTGFGGVVSFVLRADLEVTARALDACELATIAPSLGGVETLIEQPAIMSFYGLTSEARAALGISDGMVRLSVGVEDVEDIREDLARRLAVVRATTTTVGASIATTNGAVAHG
ncbi:PLP-dependent aspartate aminotransferase family protein [soil metagenome]